MEVERHGSVARPSELELLALLHLDRPSGYGRLPVDYWKVEDASCRGVRSGRQVGMGARHRPQERRGTGGGLQYRKQNNPPSGSVTPWPFQSNARATAPELEAVTAVV